MINKCPKCSADICFVQYSYDSKCHYDGVSEEVCMDDCGYRIGRWCRQELKSDEIEPPYCKGGEHPKRV